MTTTTSQLDDINVRFVHAFGAVPQRGQGGGRGGVAGGRGGGGRGGPGGRPGASNLNVTLHYRHADNSAANPFPALGGSSSTSAWDIPVNYSFTMKGLTHSARFGFNRQHAETQNLFGGVLDVAGAAGLLACQPIRSTGARRICRSAPSPAFATRTRRCGRTGPGRLATRSSRRTVRTRCASAATIASIHADSRADANARGSFVFTGLYTGVDFADFLLGLPQQASVQYGPVLDRFRSRSADAVRAGRLAGIATRSRSMPAFGTSTSRRFARPTTGSRRSTPHRGSPTPFG